MKRKTPSVTSSAKVGQQPESMANMTSMKITESLFWIQLLGLSERKTVCDATKNGCSLKKMKLAKDHKRIRRETLCASSLQQVVALIVFLSHTLCVWSDKKLVPNINHVWRESAHLKLCHINQCASPSAANGPMKLQRGGGGGGHNRGTKTAKQKLSVFRQQKCTHKKSLARLNNKKKSCSLTWFCQFYISNPHFLLLRPFRDALKQHIYICTMKQRDLCAGTGWRSPPLHLRSRLGQGSTACQC